MSMMKRLLSSLHSAVFDTSPEKALAFFIRHPDGVTWSVDEQFLSATALGETRKYDLSKLTVGQLAGQLVMDGFDVTGLSPELSSLSAMVLLSGSNDSRSGNGDRVYGFKDLLRSLFGGYARELSEAKYQVGEAIRQMVITQAEDEWLDLWGALYNTPRPFEMGDAEYQELIPKEAFRVRVNAFAIEQAILDLTGLEVTIDEPWGRMFRLDESKLSGTHKFYDGENTGYHLIRAVSQKSIDWTDVLPIVERNRAAGVIMLPPESQLGSGIDASIDGTVWFGATTIYASFVQFFAANRLNYMVLSGEEISRNWPVMMSQLISVGTDNGLLDPESIAYKRSIAKAAVVLSAGAALGDLNAVLSRYEVTQLGSEKIVSGNLELSNITQRTNRGPVNEIFDQLNPKGEFKFWEPEGAMVGRVELHGASSTEALNGDTLSHREDLLSILKTIPEPAGVAVTVSSLTGYTWRTASNWGEYPWGISTAEFDGLELAAQKLNNYVENNMSGDLT